MILKKISADDKTMANYLEGKMSQWIEMEGAIQVSCLKLHIL